MMLHKLNNRQGQNTAEYAILIALVVAGVIAMQTYTQRNLQGKIKRTADWTPLADVVDDGGQQIVGATIQYEPYYLDSDYTNQRQDREVTKLDDRIVARAEDAVRQREGEQRSLYAVPANAGNDPFVGQ